MTELPPFRPSRPISVRLPAVVIDALAAQRPPEFPSVNAWISAAIHALIDRERLSDAQNDEWCVSADPLPRAGRR
jgi:hypothetical protein